LLAESPRFQALCDVTLYRLAYALAQGMIANRFSPKARKATRPYI
jgi:hypothetical protein